MSGSSRRRSQQVERKYVKDYAYGRHSHAQKILFNQPVTPIPTEILEANPGVSPRAFTKWSRYADAVVVHPEEVLVVEAKIRRPIDGLAQLMVYRAYAHHHRDLQKFNPRPFIPVLVTPRDDPFLRPVARANGFRFEIYETADSLRYLQEKGYA